MSTSPLTPITFSGVSTYSSDFQAILSRAVQIAHIPVQQLQNRDADVLQEQTQLSSLSSTTSDFGSSLNALAQLGSNKALAASSSNTGAVTVANTGATFPATYTINSITSLATAASETTATGYADSTSAAVSSTGKLSLVFGSNTYSITLSSSQNNLVGLQNAINGLGIGVNASIITSAAGATPNYLSITSNSSGATTLKLLDDPTGANRNLLTSSDQGTNAVFQLNGIGVSRSTNSVIDLLGGVTLTLQGTTASPVTVSVATDSTKISSALQTFVTNYTALQKAVIAQVGPNAGLLGGDFIVRQIEQDLRLVASYQGTTGSIKSLADLGITFDNSGNISFDSQTFSNLSQSQISDALSFLGSATTGLGSKTALFNQITDPVSGLAKLQQDSYTQTDKNLQAQITTLTDRINTMQTNLNARLDAADALVAGLQNQQSVLTASITSLNNVLYGKPQNSNQ